MNKLIFVLIISILIVSCSGSTLIFKDATFEPAEVSPGDKVMFKVYIEDSEGIIKKVFSTWKKDSNYQVELNDKGENGDKIMADGIWSSTFDVPWSAPANVYKWDFKAFDNDGKLIKIITDDSGEKPLIQEASVKVVH